VTRVALQPGELIDRSRTVEFSFDGKRVGGFEGDTIASALYAAGQRTFSRSFKYHRRRGLLCCAGNCPNCLVAVDDAPGVRACTEPARAGARVEHMNAWPSLERDLMSVTDAIGGPVTPPGFYYKTFIRPRRLWPLYEWVLRHAAGLGRLPREQSEREWRTEYRRRHADVLVVGGGATGLSAAIDAAQRGDDVVLVDDGPRPGGRLLWAGDGGFDRAVDLTARALALGVELLSPAVALGYYDGLVPVWQGDTLHQIRAGAYVSAMGTIEQPLLFEGNDLPGVMLSSGAQRLLRLYGVLPGRRAVVVGDGSGQLDLPGVEIVTRGDSATVAKGRRQVERAVVDGREYECDLVVVCGPEVPAGLAGLSQPEPFDVRPAEPARGKAFVCLCEDVTAKDIGRAVREGYDSIELCKRFTTVTMGPCQGKLCQHMAVGCLARETGESSVAVGTTTARPPWSSVPLGALAGRPFEPAKRSAIHGRHVELGARIEWAGDWLRAYDYGDPAREALAVHEDAGLIDVSTLGKLLVRGADAGAFLDRLYPNRLSNLKPGRVRYGVLTTDAGRIMDDGTICRLDDETFYVTTTSSGAGAVEQWFAWWLADWRLEVTLTDVTQALSAINLAGPRSREILSGLTALDCSPEAFTYLDGKQAQVAGVDALLLRIGFVGELGYELHFPAAYGEHLWDTILAAGVRPFGLEPQRILRLQKQHILVGQDTDSESTPYGAAMPWAVKLDKEEAFIGRWALEGAPEPATKLVGFTVPDGRVPTEGAVVLGDGDGLVTSARFSPQLGRVIGLAWVPAALAHDGARFTIADERARLTASVVTEPFHDPAGELLRS
jgi:sarcosine oxidase, subunit alpha